MGLLMEGSYYLVVGLGYLIAGAIVFRSDKFVGGFLLGVAHGFVGYSVYFIATCR